MEQNKVILIHATNLMNAAGLAYTLGEARKYFAELNLPQPPLPDDVVPYAGCDVMITETKGPRGERLGKVVLADASGTRYERDWLIAAAIY